MYIEHEHLTGEITCDYDLHEEHEHHGKDALFLKVVVISRLNTPA